jgi:hypothetical protein
VLGASADGMSVLTTDIQDGRRVDVWSFESGKHVVGWRPYPQEPDKEQKVAFARGVTAEQILTVGVSGKIVLWSLPDCKPVYVAEVPELTAVQCTPDDKYLAGLQRGVVRVFEIASGKLAGELEPPFPPLVDPNAPKVLALRPDGKEAAAILGKAGEAPHLVRWDLSTGKMLYDASFRYVAPTGLKLAYAGPKHMLIDDRELFDLERKTTVWGYHLQPGNEGKIATERPDNRCWYAVSTGFNQENSSLVAATIPEFDVEKYVQTIADGPNALLRPGTRLAVQLNFNGAESGEARNKTLEVLRQSFERRGLKVADSADMVLQVTVSQRDTGETIEFRKMFPNIGENPFATKSVSVIELDCQSALLVSGAEMWKSSGEKLNMRHIFGILHLPDKNTDIGQYLHSQLWANVPAWADRAALPRFLARSKDGVQALPGNSTLSASGVQTGNPTVQRN